MKVKRVLERNLENRKNTKTFQSRLDNPFDVNVSKAHLRTNVLKRGDVTRPSIKSGIIEVLDTAKIESRKRRSVLDVKSVKKGFIPKS